MCTHTHNPNVSTEKQKKWMYTVIIWIHFVVAIFSWHSYAQQVFLAPFTGVLNSIFCLWLSLISSVRDLSGRGKCLPIFFRGLMCMYCVCVCTCAHTLWMWGTQMWAQAWGRNTWRAWKKSRCTVAIVNIYTVQCIYLDFFYLDFFYVDFVREIQMFCSNSTHTYIPYSVYIWISSIWISCGKSRCSVAIA